MLTTGLQAATAAAGCLARSMPILAHDGPHEEWLECPDRGVDQDTELHPSSRSCREAPPDTARHFLRARAGT
jgi:hypothetical protein